MAYARHIKNGRVLDYVVKANRELDHKLTSGDYCTSCARPFGPGRLRRGSTDSCEECAASFG